MSQSKAYWALLLATCVFFQTTIHPVASAPATQQLSKKKAEQRQALTPSQFSLAATRFIVLLPFLPLMMFVPGITGILMPMVMALQDRLQTMAPNVNRFNLFGNRPGSNATAAGGGGGSVSNPGATKAPVVAETTTAATTAAPTTAYRYRRTLFKSPAEALNEGFREVFEFLHKTDDAFNLLTSSQPDCRRQAVCRSLSSLNPGFSKFIGNVLEIFKVDSKVEKLDVSDTTRYILKEILQAATTGLFQQDCSTVFSKCNVVVSRRRFG